LTFYIYISQKLGTSNSIEQRPRTHLDQITPNLNNQKVAQLFPKASSLVHEQETHACQDLSQLLDHIKRRKEQEKKI